MVDRFLVVRWLLGHVNVLREIATIVAGWAEATLAQRLDIVHKIAQALLPVIESFPMFQAHAAPITEEDAEEELRTVEALGLPIPLLIHVIAPLIVGLIRIIMDRNKE
jgi:hypothetical protein